jgi:hypothetical protein
MNNIISLLVAIFSVAVVAGAAVWGIQTFLGEYSILAWIVAGFFGFMAIMAKINS